MADISVMQGRLSSPFEGRFQAFPADSWKSEFTMAKDLGLYSIEWIFEVPHAQDNPLSTQNGIAALQAVINNTEVRVKSVCADYYMSRLLIEKGGAKKENWDHLAWLLAQGKKLDIVYVILPFVDSSSLKTKEDLEILIEELRVLLKKTEGLGIEIHLETDLSPKDFLYVLEAVNHPLLKMNYDTGNSASLGYNPDEEFELLGKYLGSVHIKDRMLGGGTVALGTGNTNFSLCFKWFKKLHFNRWFVLQPARGVVGQEMVTIAKQRDYVFMGMQANGS